MDNNSGPIEQEPNILLTDLEIVQFSCEHCKEAFLNENDLHMHCRLHEGKAFKCSMCDEHFSNLNQLKSHDLFHSLEEAEEHGSFSLDSFKLTFGGISVCHICNKYFEDDEHLLNHCTLHHEGTVDQISVSNNVSEIEEEGNVIDECKIANSDSECYEKVLDFSKTPVIELEKLEIQGDIKISSCGICGKDFKNVKQFNKHLEDHAKNKNLVCNICGKNFTRSSYLKKHLLIHQRPYLSCKICGLCFPQERLTEHVMQFHDPKRKFVCTVCEKRFFLKNDLRRHLDAHAGNKNFECEICNRRFVHKSDLTRHSRNHFGLKPFQCTLCKKKFVRNFHLQRHSELHKITGNCTMSPVVHYVNQRDEMNHDMLDSNPVSPKKADVCYVCRKTLSKNTDFLKHFAAKHKHLKVNQCHLCFMQFQKYSKVMEHIAWHTGEKMPLTHTKLEICHVCDRKFSKKAFLEKHFAMNHTDLKVNECHICRKKFSDNSEMLQHVYLHKNKKKRLYVCQLCPKSFLSHSGLQHHVQQSHSKKKVVNCKICNKNFKSLSLLKIHSLNHKKKFNLFSCKMCAKRFSSKKLLSDHLKSQHSDVQKKTSFHGRKQFKLGGGVDIKRSTTFPSKEKRNRCLECAKTFSKRDQLVEHKKVHKKKRFSCNICPQKFTSKKELAGHIAVHEEVKKFECSYDTGMMLELIDCMPNKKTSETSKINGDALTETTKSNKLDRIQLEQYSDEISEAERFSVAKKNLLQNKKKSPDSLPDEAVNKSKTSKQQKEKMIYPCDQCKKCFIKEHVLEKHKKVWHPPEVEDYACEQCGETFHEKFNLDVHKISHEETTLSHECKKCDSTFIRKSLLVNHIKKVHVD